MPRQGRVADVVSGVTDVHSVALPTLLDRLSEISVRGLSEMYEPRSLSFPRTLREGAAKRGLVAQGMSVRYAAIAALGLSRLAEPARRGVLAGRDVGDLVPGILGLALAGRDPGATALSVWAAVEVAAATGPDVVLSQSDRLTRAIDKLSGNVRTASTASTVEHAWALVALLAAARSSEATELAGGADQLADATYRAAHLLLAAQGPSGLFPHVLPAERLGRFRSHVGCFADQAYAIQALARYATATGDRAALDAAARCADRLVALQGPQGQWWWHYDWRYGSVVERYPVYSVHQHAMAPMALRELHEAGGRDHRAAVESGLLWVLERPETTAELIEDDLGVVWRKVGRRDPRKVVRKVRSAASAARPELRLSWLDRIFPADTVDRECRPYELGWLLYAWHVGAESAAPAPPDDRQDVAVSLPRARTRISPDATRRIFGLTMDAVASTRWRRAA